MFDNVGASNKTVSVVAMFAVCGVVSMFAVCCYACGCSYVVAVMFAVCGVVVVAMLDVFVLCLVFLLCCVCLLMCLFRSRYFASVVIQRSFPRFPRKQATFNKATQRSAQRNVGWLPAQQLGPLVPQIAHVSGTGY